MVPCQGGARPRSSRLMSSSPFQTAQHWSLQTHTRKGLTMNIEHLKERSAWLRKEVFEMVMRSRKGHIPSAYSCAEVVLALYYGGYLRHDPKQPRWEDRDRLFIS